jgi:hypothetical protein
MKRWFTVLGASVALALGAGVGTPPQSSRRVPARRSTRRRRRPTACAELGLGQAVERLSGRCDGIEHEQLVAGHQAEPDLEPEQERRRELLPHERPV